MKKLRVKESSEADLVVWLTQYVGFRAGVSGNIILLLIFDEKSSSSKCVSALLSPQHAL
jgi:hypothetical protein